jgi:hypothetical protein
MHGRCSTVLPGLLTDQQTQHKRGACSQTNTPTYEKHLQQQGPSSPRLLDAACKLTQHTTFAQQLTQLTTSVQQLTQLATFAQQPDNF